MSGGAPVRDAGPVVGGRIRPLAPTLANQIAAGEVVERPASVLKELLENSLDANARRVRVEVDGGGELGLRVTDDGDGIAADDLLLALERHATSKIATLEELEAVVSMGFRGEALPSIASVARLRIESRARGSDGAWAVTAEGGCPRQPPAPSGHPQGTTVSVRDLFFNTPVRRRFLRTPRTEFRHVERAFRRLALAAFPVAMTLVHDTREVLRLPAASTAEARRRRVARLLGPGFADGALEFAEEAAGLRLWGWLGDPARGRERVAHQHLCVNGRAVADATVRHAVRLGYGELLPAGLQPEWLLYLELDPRDVDVNVHPSKQEVRFREARMVHDFVRSAVRGALTGAGEALGAAPTIALPGAEARQPYGPRDAAREAGTRPSAASGPVVLAVQEDGVVLARDGARLLLARSAGLRRAHARATLAAAARDGVPAVARPLLIPERLALPGGRRLGPEVVDALCRLGFELRPSAGDGLLLLAMPDALAGVALAALVTTLAAPPGDPGDAGSWVEPLSALAGRTPLADVGEAERVWRALTALGGSPPWVALDAAAADRLLAGDS